MSVAGGAYRALTGIAGVTMLPFEWAARAEGGDRAARFGDGDTRGSTWVHAASVGEVAAAVPLVKALGAHRPQDERLVSATTPGGLAAWRRELERRAPGAAPVAVTAWPLDVPWVVARAFDRRKPRRLLIVETEIWPNALAEAFGRGVRVAFANARLSEAKWGRTKWLAPVVGPLLSRVSAVVAQTEADRERWAALGVPRDALTVAGNTKYDTLAGLPEIALRPEARRRAGLPESRPIWIWGSVRPGEEQALREAALAAMGWSDRPLLLVVPRHPDQAEPVRTALTRARIPVTDWTPGERLAPDAVVAWVPKVGVLRELYPLADVATVGGTFAPYGGHNPAEPATVGVPVVVGPHHGGVRDVVETLAARGGGLAVVSGLEAADVVRRWLAPETLTAARAGARRAIEDLAGASARTVGFLEARGFWG